MGTGAGVVSVLLALVVGAAILGVIAWWFWAHAVVCWEIPVGRWHGRAAKATCLANGVLVVGVLAYLVGREIVG